MAEFNITGSKIEQINEHGDNLKVGSNSTVVSGSEKAIVTTGSGQNVKVESPKSSVMQAIVKWFNEIWKWVFGTKK